MKSAMTNTESFWLLIYTKVNQEKKADENLARQGFKTLLPLMAKSNDKKNIKSLVPVFPRYLFVQIAKKDQNWSVINSSYGVSKVIMFSEELPFIPETIIQRIKTKLDKDGIFREQILNAEYQKGDSLVIKEGPFAGLDATFLSNKSRERVSLLLRFLNTTVKAEISKSDIGNKKIIKNFRL